MATVQIVLNVVLALMVLAGISMMSKVQTAVRGNQLSALAMLIGVVATLCFAGVVSACTVAHTTAIHSTAKGTR